MGGDAKYGRLFTEADVLLILREYAGVLEDHPAPEVALREIADDDLTFPADEPLFLLRGKDRAARVAVAGYGGQCLALGAPASHVADVEEAWDAMREWQEAHPGRVKVPD